MRETAKDGFLKTGEIPKVAKRPQIIQEDPKTGKRPFLIDPQEKPKFVQPRIKVTGEKLITKPNRPIVINENEEEKQSSIPLRPGTGKSVATNAGRDVLGPTPDDDDLFNEYDRSIKQKYT
jgi:hypothetical protein